MVSINKDNQHAITDVSSFISRQWQVESNRYINIDFDSINKNEYKINCLSEQQYVCCYCSREIENTPQTELEHIIPKSINTIDSLQRYLDLSPILLNNIILQEDFRKSTEEQNTPPFPHHIAYQNIVASCNGKIVEQLHSIERSKLKSADQNNCMLHWPTTAPKTQLWGKVPPTMLQFAITYILSFLKVPTLS